MLCFATSPTRRKLSASPIARSMFSPAWAIFPRCRTTDCAYKFITAACCFVMNFNPTPPKGVWDLLCFAASPTRRKLNAFPIVRSMFSPAWAIFPLCRTTDCINSPAQILRGAVFFPQASTNRCELPQNILQLVILCLNSTICISLKYKKAPGGCFFSSYTNYSASSTLASGAFLRTLSTPFLQDAFALYPSEERMISPLRAFRRKRNSPALSV